MCWGGEDEVEGAGPGVTLVARKGSQAKNQLLFSSGPIGATFSSCETGTNSSSSQALRVSLE